MCAQYMCILFYVKLIWCNNMSIDLLSIVTVNWNGIGVDVCSVYVHSAICETYVM